MRVGDRPHFVIHHFPFQDFCEVNVLTFYYAVLKPCTSPDTRSSSFAIQINECCLVSIIELALTGICFHREL